MPAEGLAFNKTVPEPQRQFGVVPIMVGVAYTLAATAVLVAVVQPLLLAFA